MFRNDIIIAKVMIIFVYRVGLHLMKKKLPDFR